MRVLRLSFGARAIGAGVGLVTLALVGWIALQSHVATKSVVRLEVRDMHNTSSIVVSAVRSFLLRTLTLTKIFSFVLGDKLQEQEPSSSYDSLLQSFLKTHPLLDAVVVVLPQGIKGQTTSPYVSFFLRDKDKSLVRVQGMESFALSLAEHKKNTTSASFSSLRAYALGEYGTRRMLMIASPILDPSGTHIGLLAFMIRDRQLLHFLRKGDASHTYALISHDGRWVAKNKNRGNLLGRPIVESDPHYKAALKAIRQGHTFTVIDKQDDTVDLFSPISLGLGTPLSLMTTLSLSKAQAASAHLRFLLTLGLLALIIVIGGLLWFSGVFFLLRPMERLASIAHKIEKGRYSFTAPYHQDQGPMGVISRALNFIRQQLISEELVPRSTFGTLTHPKEETSHNSVDIFSGDLGGKVTQFFTTSSKIAQKADDICRWLETATKDVQSVSSASETMTSHVSEISYSTGGLSESMDQIAREAEHSTQISSKAVEEVSLTSEMVKALVLAVDKINATISLISDIASKTDLLALNAAIEASRAGIVGKGFSVVAREVKGLAHQTSSATEQISSHIKSIKEETHATVIAIHGIRDTIAMVHKASTTIASAVQKQKSSTQSIASNVEAAAHGTGTMQEHAHGLGDMASHAQSMAQDMQNMAISLVEQVEELMEEIEHVFEGEGKEGAS